MSTQEFYFIRHGQTERHKNDATISLNDVGRTQAANVAPLVKKLALGSVCHSPFNRVVETKDLITQDLALPEFVIEELGECSLKEWLEMTATSKDQWSDETRNFVKRVMSGLEKSFLKPGPVLVVAHGGVHFALCRELDVQNHQWIVDNCRLIHFKKEENQWMAKTLNGD